MTVIRSPSLGMQNETLLTAAFCRVGEGKAEFIPQGWGVSITQHARTDRKHLKTLTAYTEHLCYTIKSVP